MTLLAECDHRVQHEFQDRLMQFLQLNLPRRLSVQSTTPSKTGLASISIALWSRPIKSASSSIIRSFFAASIPFLTDSVLPKLFSFSINVTSNLRTISDVLSTDPSLTTIISSING